MQIINANKQETVNYLVYVEEIVTGWVHLAAAPDSSKADLECLLKKLYENRSIEIPELHSDIRLVDYEEDICD